VRSFLALAKVLHAQTTLHTFRRLIQYASLRYLVSLSKETWQLFHPRLASLRSVLNLLHVHTIVISFLFDRLYTLGHILGFVRTALGQLVGNRRGQS
jgi:hypothetical protein